ncbi:MAG: type II toxin-antitoxin system VapC family toxin [Pirellulales bacterium]|nr:type II toxin-antitoxin system VapC family toxin [Pirellulales bacterium]
MDTTVLVDLLRSNRDRKQRALDKIEQLATKGETIVTTRFTLAELYVGVVLSADPGKNHRRIHAILDDLDAILEFDDLAAQTFGQMAAHLRRIGRPTGDMDVLIAATCLAAGHNLLITRNSEHFSFIPGLVLENY